MNLFKALIKILMIIYLIISCTLEKKKYYVKKDTTEKYSIPYRIMGKGNLKPNIMAKFISSKNSTISYEYALYLANIYIEEAEKEGVNYDIAFAQMCLETAYLRFGNQVTEKQNNFAGIGALDGGSRGNSFPSPRIGIRAQIQHLKAYASTEETNEEIVDPRFNYVKRGIATSIHDLSGRWASDKNYGEKIEKILIELYNLQKNDYYLNR